MMNVTIILPPCTRNVISPQGVSSLSQHSNILMDISDLTGLFGGKKTLFKDPYL